MKKMIFLSLISIFLSANTSFAAGQCSKEEQNAQQACSEEKFTGYKAELAAVNEKLKGMGVGEQAQAGGIELATQKSKLDSLIALCEEKRQGCVKTCQSDAQQKRARTPVPDEPGAQQDDQKRKKCETEVKEKKENAQKTSDGMGEAMKALAGLLQALGAGSETPQETAQQPFCTQYPTDPACKEDKPTDTSSTLTAGEFRRDDGGAFSDGELGSESDPSSGPAAQASNSSPMGGAGLPMMGAGAGGGGGGKSAEKDSGKKSEFDGTPKINMAGGAMGAGGGGGARGGGSSLGKGSGNPIASRTGLGEENQANKVAAAAEDRLRGPASNNEPLGGISSVYYLDNFTKVEKRMVNERNTLKEN